jgi:hypothetical protein
MLRAMSSDNEDLRTTVRMRCGKTSSVTLILFTRTGTSAQFRIEKVLVSTSNSELSTGQGSELTSDRYDRNQFDWSGWYCPSCGHYKDGKSLHGFIRCGGCHELVCGFSARDVGPGISTWKCFCGHSARIGGRIDSFEGQSAAKTKALASDADIKALPPPKHS